MMGEEIYPTGKQFGTFIRNLKISISFDLKFHSWEYVLTKSINMESLMHKNVSHERIYNGEIK